MAVFSRFCEIVGIALKPGKSEVGAKINFAGPQDWFPPEENRYAMRISLLGGRGMRGRPFWPIT